MRLLRAELRKLRRPLSVWTAVAVVVIVGLFAWGSQKNASENARFIAQYSSRPPPCEAFGLQPGVACARAQQKWQEQAKQEIASQGNSEALSAAMLRSPLGAGRMAAEMMASLVGAVVLLLLAAGHVGNEWSGRTIKQVLAQEGRRWRVLAAKLGSLVVAGVGLLLVLWAVLAALAPVFDAAYPLPVNAHAGAALHTSLASGLRSLLVIVAFAVLGMLCAVITRNTLGSFFLGFAFVIATLILSGFTRVTKLTLAYWVTGWMRFHTTNVILTHIWRDEFFPVRPPSVAAGLVGLGAFAVVCAALALARMQRSDVKV
jgi:ABC-type transport system involved in multi-copper enzyme maturation permease subunit